MTILQSQLNTTIEANANGRDPLDMTEAQMKAMIAELQAANAKLRQDKAKAAVQRVTIKVSEKGAVSIYGLGRFPVTLYQGQMRKLMALKDEVLAFIDDNQDRLATKD